MGNLIWHEYSRFVSITASCCEWHAMIPDCGRDLTVRATDAVWASFFGLIYRKFFWDFVGGTLRDPGGLQFVPIPCSHSSTELNLFQAITECRHLHHANCQDAYHPNPHNVDCIVHDRARISSTLPQGLSHTSEHRSQDCSAGPSSLSRHTILSGQSHNFYLFLTDAKQMESRVQTQRSGP